MSTAITHLVLSPRRGGCMVEAMEAALQAQIDQGYAAMLEMAIHVAKAWKEMTRLGMPDEEATKLVGAMVQAMILRSQQQ